MTRGESSTGQWDANEAAVSRRPRRQPASTTGSSCRRATTSPPARSMRRALRAIEDDAIREVVRKQEEIGLQSATDGEFRRASWHMDFIYQLDGISKEAATSPCSSTTRKATSSSRPAALHVDAKLGVSKTIFGDDFRFLQDTVTRAVPKLTIPSPSMVHYRAGRAAIDPSVYADMDAFWADLTAAYAEEVRRLGELGCTYLQFDDTSLAYMNDPHQRDYIGLDRRRSRAAARRVHPPHQRVARTSPGRA